MRIVLLGHKEIYSNLALSLVVNKLCAHDLSIFLSGSASNNDAPPGTVDHLELYESQLCDKLPSLAVNQDERRAAILTFDELARKTGQAIGALPSPNSAPGLAALRAVAPDLIVSLRYRKILKDEAIAISPCGVLNLHSGLLPDYRGAMATFWALLQGDREIGSTLHYIIDGTIDTGPVIGRAKMPLDPERPYMASVLNLYPSGCDMVLDAIRAIEQGGSVPAVKQQGQGHYYSWPHPDQVDQYLQQGYHLYGEHDVEDFVCKASARRTL